MSIYDSLMGVSEALGCSFDVAYALSVLLLFLLPELLVILFVKVFDAFHKKDDEKNEYKENHRFFENDFYQ